MIIIVTFGPTSRLIWWKEVLCCQLVLLVLLLPLLKCADAAAPVCSAPTYL